MQFGFEAHTQDHGVPFRIALTPQVGWTCPWCTVRSLSHLGGSKAISDQANCHPVWFFGPLPISEYVVLGSTPFGVFWSSQFDASHPCVVQGFVSITHRYLYRHLAFPFQSQAVSDLEGLEYGSLVHSTTGLRCTTALS